MGWLKEQKKLEAEIEQLKKDKDLMAKQIEEQNKIDRLQADIKQMAKQIDEQNYENKRSKNALKEIIKIAIAGEKKGADDWDRSGFLAIKISAEQAIKHKEE